MNFRIFLRTTLIAMGLASVIILGVDVKLVAPISSQNGNGTLETNNMQTGQILYNSEEELMLAQRMRPSLKPFCVPWSVNTDEWWTHNPEWEVYNETDSSYCFRVIEDPMKFRFFGKLYLNQWHNDCRSVIKKSMWSSGWGADISNIVAGLISGQMSDRPMSVDPQPWHYAAPVEADHANEKPVDPVCPLKNMFCYFLNITNCTPREDEDATHIMDIFSREPPNFDRIGFHNIKWTREYLLRQQTWLRHRVYQFLRNQTAVQRPCTVLHVRRGDVVLHEEASRKYHPISEYLKADSITIHENILLLTDDANAIGEALANFPEKNWMYIDRPRWKAAEGGWERQLPSNDPIFEVVVLLSIFQMVSKCDNMVRSSSGFGELLQDHMPVGSLAVNLDEGRREVHSLANNATVSISREYNISSMVKKRSQ